MSGYMEDVVRLCCEISAEKKIKAAITSSAKGAAAAGGGAFVGGLLGGPVGIAVGSAVGGALGAWMTSGQFKPLPEILMELAPAQKEKLYSEVMAVLGTMKWTNPAQLISQVMGNGVLKDQVLAAIVSYATKELKADVKYD
ncbi:Protein C19orf12 -like protein [Triplophysa tibetana]|uniref:Protein C19orf12-like protein n=1 Tax=Triplophysa tibetana TaxID=1572043 RepID=A0A5A9PP03_9TELE|nr:Protein C19orf12 -like protein [Triplophysa tibetana]